MTEHIEAKSMDDNVVKLENEIRNSLGNRGEFPRSNKEKSILDFIRIVHSHESIEFAKMREILYDSTTLSLLHTDKPPTVCDKQVPPIGLLLCNFTKCSLDLSDVTDDISEQPCQCTTILKGYKNNDLVNGHIMTCNYNIIPHLGVKSLFEYGTKFRKNLSKESVMEAIDIGLEEYVTRRIEKERKYNLTNIDIKTLSDDLYTWKLFVSIKCKENLDNSTQLRNIQRKQLGESIFIKLLKHNFFIGHVDKASHNLSIVCKKYYKHQLYQELNSDAYENVTESRETILERHKAFNIRHDLGHVDNLPYLYGTPKMHKNPPKFRFVAGVHSTEQEGTTASSSSRSVVSIHHRVIHSPKISTTAASIKLSEYLQTVMTILKEKDEILYRNKGYRRCWFEKSAEGVFYDIKRNKADLIHKKPRTFDFSTMYTCLPHDKIFANLRVAINEASNFQRALISATAKLPHDHDISTTEKIDNILNLVYFVVQNTYLDNNDATLKHQSIGIPMGTNAAPELANLTLYVDEAHFIDQLILNNQKDVALLYKHTYRFIDDILNWDVEPPSSDIYGLRYSEQTLSDGSVTFLGAKIQLLSNGSLRMSVFDKTSEYLFSVIKFSHYDSNSPEHQSAGIFQGQLVRYRHICNSMRDFKLAVTLLSLRMLSRGHPPAQLTKGWNKHLLRYPKDKNTNYSSLRRWFRRMLFWVASNKDKKDVQELIINRTSATPTNETPSTAPAIAPSHTPTNNAPSTTDAIVSLPYSPPIPNISNDLPHPSQNNAAVSTENLWSTTYTRHIIAGDGDCFFSSVNCCMKFLDPDWSHDSVSLRSLALAYLKTEVYKIPLFYLDYLPNPPDNTNLDLSTIDSIWDIIKAKYQDPGQFVDDDIIMATVSALNLDIQLHGGSSILLNIEGRIPSHTIHLLYCGLPIDNNPGNHYDALTPIISSNENAPIVNATLNTQASNTEDIDNSLCSQSTQVSEYDPDSSSSHTNDATIYTETLLSKYLNHPILFTHRKRILLFLNRPNNSSKISKKRKTCKICFCRFRALHLHGKSKNSKALCQFFQSIREQLLPLHFSSLGDDTATQTSEAPSN